MKASDIKDEDSLRLWLETRPQAEGLVMRAVMRVLPFAFSDVMNVSANHIVSILLRGSLEKSRLLLQNMPSPADMEPKFHRHNAAAFVDRLLGSHETLMVFDASLVFWSARVKSGYISSLTKAVATTLTAADPVQNGYWLQISQANTHRDPALRRALWEEFLFDCYAVERNERVLNLPLWHIQIPGELLWDQTRTRWAQPNSPYTFWLRWYEAALEGRSLNPELERDIALIPDAEWEKGAAHIAGLIALIEERYDLKAQVQALRQQLTLAQAAAASDAHRGHNQPPELIDSAPEVQRQITIIFDTLDDAEKELSKFAPSPSRLKVIGEALLNSAAIIARYCGGIANKAVGAAAVAFGTAGGALAAAKLIQFVTPVKTLGQSITDFALKWLGG